jgi:hypothetical protein
LLRDDNAFPTAPEIITPEDGATVQVFEGGNNLEDGTFSSSTDANGDLLVYTIEITAPEDTMFLDLLACSKVGTDTSSNATINAVYEVLIANGAVVGISVPLRYRVVGSDGSVSTPGGSRTITLMITDPPCNIEGGTLALSDGGTALTICALNGIPDPFNVVLTDTVGTDLFTYLVVSDQGIILGVPANQPFDFDGAGGGACTLYAIAHNGSLTGAIAGEAFTDLGGCFAASNPVVVTRNTGNDCDGCDVEGGTLSLMDGGTTMRICAGDSIADPFNVTLIDTVGAAFTYLVVSDQGVILGVPADQPFDFDGAGGGSCTLYAVSHDGTLGGAVQDSLFANLTGCFDLSNAVVVTRLTGEACADLDCGVDGGVLTLSEGGTTLTICAGDSIADPFNVTLTDTIGADFTYIVVGDDGIILGTPANQPFDFDGAGGGACTLYAVSHYGSLMGATTGLAFTDLSGCFELSNPIVVTRLTGEDCTGGLIGINEVDRRGMIELENISDAAVNVSSLFLASNEEVVLIGDLAIECGSYFLKPHDRVTLDLSGLIDVRADELALLISDDYTSAGYLLAYVAWGDGDRRGESMAADLGIWTMGTNPGYPSSAVSLQRIPDLEMPTYALGAPTPCAPNQLSTSTPQPAANQIDVFPNPFSDQLTLEVRGARSQWSEIQILDINGRLIISRQLQITDGRIDLPTG